VWKLIKKGKHFCCPFDIGPKKEFYQSMELGTGCIIKRSEVESSLIRIN